MSEPMTFCDPLRRYLGILQLTDEGCWAVRYSRRRWLWFHRSHCEMKYL